MRIEIEKDSLEPLEGDVYAFPLSFAQQRLWYLHQLEPASAAYNIPLAYRLNGLLKRAALEQSLNNLAQRHEILRTTFSLRDGEPVQIAHSASPLSLSITDLRPLREPEREETLRRLLLDDATRPFELDRGPLFRVALIQTKDDEHIFFLNMHHIVSDEWSLRILFQELASLYTAYSNEAAPSLAELPIQYADYSVWQRDWLQGQNLEAQLSYWRKQLADVPTINLPIDRPRPAVQTYCGGEHVISISPKVCDQLKSLSRQEGITFFMTLLAAFQILLHRYAGQDDVSVGTPIAGRTRPEIEGLIGFFVNTLVIRPDTSGNPTVKEFLARVCRVALDAYDHQDLPFERLVQELNPERDLSRSPLFQTMFAFPDGSASTLVLPNLQVSRVSIVSEMAKFDLSATVTEAEDSLRVSFTYNTDLFNADTIERMLGHFRNLLEGIVANPEQRINELPLLTEAENHQLLVEWNDTKREYPRDKCIHELFEEQVERTPEAVAVDFEDQQLTYRELNNRANQLAHYLQKLGVGPEVLVGICLERSIETVVGLLGILKAGGAYVPLDPSYPKERLAFMLHDSSAPALITQQAFVDEFIDCAAKMICLDTDWGKISQGSESNLASETSSESLAYVIYTSGSTGQPKGVAVSHRAVNRLVMNTDYVRLTSSEVMAQASNVSFDAATFEIWGALLNGARLVLIAKETLLSPQSLSTAIERHGITTLFLTTALFNQMVEQIPTALGKLRNLLFGGEAVDSQRVRDLLHNGAPARLLHVYGPTETTTFASWYWVKAVAADATTVPIGHPVANTEIYVLDSHRNPVPIGVVGEIHIGGDGLAQGYLNRPELSAEKFMTHCFDGKSAKRLYRTGDLARYLPDGNIEFLGRIDNQVKLRGYRIELGEIEAVLGQLPAIREAVVLVREDSPGERRLVAYVVARPETSTNELRSFLKQKLPDYMVPQAFVFMDSVPLTPNGKVDRKALPVPDQTRAELDETFSAPRTATEELLANIWAQVLKLEKVGIHDNFFELGGHSLLATQVMSRLTKAFQIELPLRSLFESPTVAGLAKLVEDARRQQQGLPTLPILAVSRDKDIPVSFAQRRLWFLDQYEPNGSVYNMPSALRLKGPLNVGALEQSLNEIVRRHESLRTTFSVVDGEPMQIIAPALRLFAPITDLSNHPEGEREKEAQRLTMEQAQERFDLSQGPLLRVTLLRLGDDDHVLALTMHHIVSDGWSLGVLHRELSSLYQAYMHGLPSPLSELAIQYADFAIWQRQWLQGAVLENQLSYWKKQLAGAPAILNLPTDRSRPAVQTYRGESQSVSLSQELTEGLRTLSSHQGVTLFMTLLAAFQILLHRYTGQNDIVVGSPIASRNHAEIEGLIGFLINNLVLRTDLSGNPTFKELLTRVRETALGAYAHQDLPFEKLVEEIHPERSLGHSPLFQVLFNMVELENNPLNLSGLEAEKFSTTNLGSKFDLTIYARSQSGGIQLELVYNADLFDQARMARALQQYCYLLEQIVSAPEKRVRSYSLVTPASRLLLPDPSTVLSEAPQQLVTSIFLSWANRSSDHPAVRQGGRSWTYRQLAECAETLALAMVAKGLERGDVVAIYGDRSFGMIAGMIATLLSGGILLPIDRSLPDRRKLLMLTEAKAKKFLYVGAKQADNAWLEEESSLDIMTIAPQTGYALTADPKPNSDLTQLPEVSADDAAYIFFTSGTTGVPKGILGCHKGLSHFLNWQRTTFAIAPNDRIAQLTGLSFDAVMRDIFLPLTSGATLCLPEATLEIGSDQTIDWLAQEHISVLHTVPTVAHAWFDNLPQGASLVNMRCVFFAGEPLPASLVKRFREIVPIGGEMINLYGPTETTLVKCFYRVPADACMGIQPVGHALPDTQALVLTDDHQLCGFNEAGEIVLRTPFRSLGYLNAPSETQQRFVRNPFRDDASDLIYFTGDAGRYQPDGTLEILGRLDDQIKIRGVRIEPIEVTAILDRHPLVKSCIVVARRNERDETYLVAYVVVSEQGKVTSKVLRSYLRAQLPAAMVPSNFVFLDKLPLTPNGKVDRRGLPMPESIQRGQFVAPRTPVEEKIAEIWAEVLRVDKVGIDDNFFELGGHSLLATQVVSRLRVYFNYNIPLRSLFEAPTVEDLATMIIKQQARLVSETEMERLLEDVEAMSSEDAERGYKDQLMKAEQ